MPRRPSATWLGAGLAGFLCVAATTTVSESIYLTADDRRTPEQTKRLRDSTAVPSLGVEVESYAAFLKASAERDRNLFFWLFPAMNQSDKDAPLILWLQGGPGASSMFGLFAEHGPFSVTSDRRLEPRTVTWSRRHHILYIDNPVGTGFSYTESGKYPKDVWDCAEDLHAGLEIFFDVFREYKGSNFFIIGESYAGKYIPALAHRIHKAKEAGSTMPLTGFAMGNALSDPLWQVQGYGNFMLQQGLADRGQVRHIEALQAQIVGNISRSQWLLAADAYDMLIGVYGPNPDRKPYIQSIMGSENIWDVTKDYVPDFGGPFEEWLNRSAVRAAVHVGERYFYVADANVSYYADLNHDFCTSVAGVLPELFVNYHVLIYNGLNDLIAAAPLTELYLEHLDSWVSQDVWRQAPRELWRLQDGTLAGYAKRFETASPGGSRPLSFAQVVVRGAGHMVPSDQPEAAEDLIARFVRFQPIADVSDALVIA